MASPPWPGPRRSVESLSARHGRDAVVAACIDLLSGREVDGHIVYALGGPPARWAVDGAESGPDYWLRVWALRGFCGSGTTRLPHQWSMRLPTRRGGYGRWP